MLNTMHDVKDSDFILIKNEPYGYCKSFKFDLRKRLSIPILRKILNKNSYEVYTSTTVWYHNVHWCMFTYCKHYSN